MRTHLRSPAVRVGAERSQQRDLSLARRAFPASRGGGRGRVQPDLPELASFGQRRPRRPLGLAVADFLRSRARPPRPSPLNRASPRRRLGTTAPLVLPSAQ